MPSGWCRVCRDARDRRRRAQKAAVPSELYTRQDIIDRDGTDCSLCQAPVDLSLRYPDMLSPSIDHVIPISRGGWDVLTNVALAHLGCNLSKGARIDTEGVA